jgi:hypothetical protein
MSLRHDLIQATALELWRREYGADAYPPRDSEAETEFNIYTEPTAAAILDTVLDYLEAHADEWVSAASGTDLDDATQRGDHKIADVLLSSLRVGRDAENG